MQQVDYFHVDGLIKIAVMAWSGVPSRMKVSHRELMRFKWVSNTL
jgi:hypothetical protein